ncbi:McrC family protein [Spirosoma arcticum]
MKSLLISEFGLIRKQSDFLDGLSNLAELFVPDETFGQLKQLAFEGSSADGLLTFFVQKGREIIRVHNYAGLLELSDGTQLEILPKIGATDVARPVLLSMLRHLRHSPFQTLTPAHTKATRLPLWEVFISLFLDALESLVRQGLQPTYVSVEENERFWKGKFQATRHQRENAHHAERLAVAYDRLTTNIPANRVLKTALAYVQNQPVSATTQQRIRQLLWALDEVPASPSLPDDLVAIQQRAGVSASRLFHRYKPALRWAEALLGGRAFGVTPAQTHSGQFVSPSLLFPMQRVFEDYIAHGVRSYWPGAGVVTVQESSAHLVDAHSGQPKFRLRPDILIRQSGRTLVLDTKWQQVNGQALGATPATGNYGIEQADLYQLYAYGKKYAANDLFLIYPANDTFREPLPVFEYDAATRLHVVPFDPVQPLADEVEKLARYALPF